MTLQHNTDWQLVARLPGRALRVAGHDHPLEVDGHRPQRVRLLGDDDLPVEVDPAVHVLHGPLPGRPAVDVQGHPVPEDPEVDLVPVGVEDLRHLPGQRLQGAVVAQDGELHGLPGRVQAHGELRLALGVRDADQVPAPAGTAPTAAERRHEAELLRQALVEHPTGGGGEGGNPTNCR